MYKDDGVGFFENKSGSLPKKKKIKKRYVKFLKKTVWTSQLKLICILQIICMWHLIWKLENIICIENKIRVYNIFTNLE